MPSLPTGPEANAYTNANIAAFTAQANARFIATATTLIDTAIENELFQIAPYIIPYLDRTTIVNYFESLGYTVCYTPCPLYWKALGYVFKAPRSFLRCGCQIPCRAIISWNTSPMADYLLLESGGYFVLEDGSGDIILE
jgi:hypothetical protein